MCSPPGTPFCAQWNKSRRASVEESKRNRRSLPMRTPIFQICLLLSMLLLVGCGGSTAAPLPPTAATSSPATTLAQSAAPLSVYIGRAAGTVSPLNAADGTVRGPTQLAPASPPTVGALGDGLVYASANDPRSAPSRMASYAFPARDGTVL